MVLIGSWHVARCSADRHARPRDDGPEPRHPQPPRLSAPSLHIFAWAWTTACQHLQHQHHGPWAGSFCSGSHCCPINTRSLSLSPHPGLDCKRPPIVPIGLGLLAPAAVVSSPPISIFARVRLLFVRGERRGSECLARGTCDALRRRACNVLGVELQHPRGRPVLRSACLRQLRRAPGRRCS